METCKYCGEPSEAWCCPSCWDEFESERPYDEDDDGSYDVDDSDGWDDAEDDEYEL